MKTKATAQLKRTPAADPKINVSVPAALRLKAKKKAEAENKNMSQLIVALLKVYVAAPVAVKKAA